MSMSNEEIWEYEDENRPSYSDVAKIVLLMEDGEENEITAFDPLSQTLEERVLNLYMTEFREGLVKTVSMYDDGGNLLETQDAETFAGAEVAL